MRVAENVLIMLRLLPVILALAILAAHFYRATAFALMAASVALMALLVVRRPWAARTLQGALVLGALEWLRALAQLIAQRQAFGAPYARLAVILAAVALLTLAAAMVFRQSAVRRYFRLAAAPATPPA